MPSVAERIDDRNQAAHLVGEMRADSEARLVKLRTTQAINTKKGNG